MFTLVDFQCINFNQKMFFFYLFFSGVQNGSGKGGCGKYIQLNGRCYKMNGLNFMLLIHTFVVLIVLIIACAMKFQKNCNCNLMTINCFTRKFTAKKDGELYTSLAVAILSVRHFLSNCKILCLPRKYTVTEFFLTFLTLKFYLEVKKTQLKKFKPDLELNSGTDSAF